MGTWTADPYHDAWESYMEMERIQLAERASGKMRRAIGGKLAWESSEELERIAADDERRRGKLRKALGLALPGC